MELNSFLRKVFFTMTGGILISTLFALIGNVVLYQLSWINEETAYHIIWGMCIVELAFVIFFVGRVRSMSKISAIIWFTIYCVISGFTLSYIFSYFLASTLVAAFLATVICFGTMAFAGYFVKVDTYKYRNVVLYSLTALIIVEIIDIFLNSTLFTMIISAVGIVIFMGITIYDMNKLKKLYEYSLNDNDIWKYVVYGAFELYLDFINIFLRFIELFSHSSNSDN